MVSLRRRKLLGLCNGRTSYSSEILKPDENAANVESNDQIVKHVSTQHVLSENRVQKIRERNDLVKLEQVNVSTVESDESKPGSSEDAAQEYPLLEVKKRKRHKRKHIENREHCDMRGVYYKNMKWQAAIKVDKKQIHLGTVGSQEEAARLYDRAAFMCGREPNFELSEMEKQELRRLTWEEFLANTRYEIANKKNQRQLGSGMRRRSEAPMCRDIDLHFEHESDEYDYDVEIDVDALV